MKKIINYIRTALLTQYTKATFGQILTKIVLTILNIAWFITKWTMFIFVGFLLSLIIGIAFDSGKSVTREFKPRYRRY